jgi:hypothetical protein
MRYFAAVFMLVLFAAPMPASEPAQLEITATVSGSAPGPFLVTWLVTSNSVKEAVVTADDGSGPVVVGTISQSDWTFEGHDKTATGDFPVSTLPTFPGSIDLCVTQGNKTACVE